MVLIRLKQQLQGFFSNKSGGSRFRTVSVTNGKIMQVRKR